MSKQDKEQDGVLLEEITGQDKLIPDELEKARAYLKSELGYDFNYEQVRDVVKAYLQFQARRKSDD